MSFLKGCYLGQELTVHSHHVRVIRKRLTFDHVRKLFLYVYTHFLIEAQEVSQSLFCYDLDYQHGLQLDIINSNSIRNKFSYVNAKMILYGDLFLRG